MRGQGSVIVGQTDADCQSKYPNPDFPVAVADIGHFFCVFAALPALRETGAETRAKTPSGKSFVLGLQNAAGALPRRQHQMRMIRHVKLIAYGEKKK